MNPTELALLRGWIQGLSWPVLGELYLDDAGVAQTRRTVLTLCRTLARKAELLDLLSDAAIWQQPHLGNADWIDKALASLDRLKSKPAPLPKPDEPCGRWLPSPVAVRLAQTENLHTLTQLADFVNQHGQRWWTQIPRLGQTSAAEIQAFFAEHADVLNLHLDLTKKRPAHPSLPAVSSGIAPIERFRPPEHLSGQSGSNRAPAPRCLLDAGNDFEAILAWLSIYDTGTPTHRTYRKEIERFLLWAIFERGKAISSLTTPDCAEFRRFLEDPQPAERWIGPSAQRWSPQWKPFKGPLKPSSARQAEVILSACCDWLVGQRYLDSNPFSGLNKRGYGRRQGTDRILSPPLWDHLIDYAERQAGASALANHKPADYRRTLFILRFAYQTGLRLHELTKARLGDLERLSGYDGEQWWLNVLGKGKVHRQVPIAPRLIDDINAHLRDRQLKPIGYAAPDTPIIGKLRKRLKDAPEDQASAALLSESALYQKLKGFFEEAADDINQADPIAAEKIRRASTHWLRHTHGSHAVYKGVPLEIVRDNLGHKNIATTSIYVHSDKDSRYKAILGMTGD
ncbi:MULTISPECIES: phage integrase family protein [Methylomonas]|uniref:phage integrase family protein n=1 Tax=Methylomonas TaxID=416 RepID=UPI0009EEE988|nr:phage integrase family protein [Methylomonas koyamae]